VNSWLFTKKSFILFGLSAVLLAVGYILLGQGPVENHLSKSAAPVILVAVYCGLIPYAILCGDGRDGGKKEVKKQGV